MGRFIRRARGSRGATEVGFALIIAALIAGAVLGKGLAATNILTSDGLTWLADDHRGTTVQIDPTTGNPQTELKVANPGNQLDIAQRDGLLVVNDLTTGEITLIDVGTLIAGGRRTMGAGATKILLDPNQLYLVDRPRGTIHRIDPTTAADIGTAWLAGTPIADAVLDGTGLLWALGIDGRLHKLRWSGNTLLDATDIRKVTGAGPESVLVPHDTGVTIFAPEAGSVTQIGTGRDQTRPAPQLGQPVLAAPLAPADLVPATVSQTATIVIVHNGRITSIAVGQYGCPHPGDPVVHRARIYIPCLNSNKVLVLDSDGTRQQDIPTPGGDPKLVLDDGRLIVYAPGTTNGVVVNADGTTRPIHTHDDTVPVKDPATPPTPPPPPPVPRRTEPPPPSDPPTPSSTSSTSAGASAGASTTTPARSSPPPSSSPPAQPVTPTSSPPAPTQDPPSNVVAQARPDGTVLVTWTATGNPTGFLVLRADTGTTVASVGGVARQAIVTTLAPGEAVALIVEANYGSTRLRSTPTGVVQAFTLPGAPGPVAVVLTSELAGEITVDIRWGASAANGAAISQYTITVRTDHGSLLIDSSLQSPYFGFVVPCLGVCDGMIVTASVAAVNAAGTGPSTAGSLTYVAPAAPVINEALCEYAGNSSMVCNVQYTAGGTVSIRWTLNGNPVPAVNDQVSVVLGCGTGVARVTVTVANLSGSATANTGVGRCTGPIP
jgi:hypothetical protein